MFIIYDVVKLLGLLKIIVFCVINNYLYVLEEKKNLVLKVMKEFNYILNFLVRKLRG